MLEGVAGLGKDGWECGVEVSFIEIYNETVTRGRGRGRETDKREREIEKESSKVC